MKQALTFIALICFVAQLALAQQDSDSFVEIQGYQYASASSGTLSSPTISIIQPGGQFEKINDDAFVFQLPPGETLGCRFALPVKAYNVEAIVAYKVANGDAKGLVRWNGILFPEEHAVLNKGKDDDLIQKKIPLKDFRQNNLLEILAFDGSLQIRSVKILYNYRMPSCTVEDVTVTLLSPDPDLDGLTSDIKLTWKGTGPCEKGWITIKYKDGADWKTVPGAEAFDRQDDAWKDKFRGQFVWKNHRLNSFPDLKIEYNEGKNPKRQKADQFADNAIELAKEKRFDEAFAMIDNALAIFSEVKEYRNRKQEIANQIAEEALHLANEKKYDDAIVMIDKSLARYWNSNEYKQVKQKIVDQIVEEAIRLFNEKLFDEAYIMINKALSIYPYANNNKYKQVKQKICYEIACKAFNAKDYETALKKIEAALNIEPNNAEYKQVKQKIIFSKGGSQARERVVIIINGVEFAFRWCPPGTFWMGSPSSERRWEAEEYEHKVTITKGFWMMETEVTQAQWRAVMGNNPSYFKGDDLPVEMVTWKDCQEFCEKCTKLGLPVQLPTEAQWEYACRAGSTTAYFWGSALNGDKANCDGNYPCGTTTKGKFIGKTTPVGSYQPNAWGLYDMHGNVWEWCQDWYGGYPSGSVTDPTGPSSGSNRVYRGGGWDNRARYCRSAYRGNDDPEYRGYDLGFRCVKGQ